MRSLIHRILSSNIAVAATAAMATLAFLMDSQYLLFYAVASGVCLVTKVQDDFKQKLKDETQDPAADVRNTGS